VTGSLLAALKGEAPQVTVELRPPRAGLSSTESMDVWIDMYHAVRRLVGAHRYVFLTDNAVGAHEEENLAHLGANLSEETDPARLVPFLTCKHTLEHCLVYAERAWAQGFRALTVLGGDRSVGAPRCVPHAEELRSLIRKRVPDLTLGGWANPHRDAAWQADFLEPERFRGEFFLSQVVSHHSADRVEALLAELRGRDNDVPGVFGVFFYRSANPGTLKRLSEFFPVPGEALTREFEAGASAEEVCARSVRALRDAGARHVYVSNLGVRGAAATLDAILERVY